MVGERVGIRPSMCFHGSDVVHGIAPAQLKDCYLIDLEKVNNLTCYLLGLEGPGPYPDKGYLELRRALLASTTIIDLPDGKQIAILSDAMSRLVGDSLKEIRRDDSARLQALDYELTRALAEVGVDGDITNEIDIALEAWSQAIETAEAYFSTGRNTNLLTLFDMLEGSDAPYVLAGMLELFRRMLLAAVRTADEIGAATIGHFYFQGLKDATARWRIVAGEHARRLGAVLTELTSRTPGFDQLPNRFTLTRDPFSWIPSLSRFGQEIMTWILNHEETHLELASVGRIWPGPGLYGYDDGEENPQAACHLLEALCRGRADNVSMPEAVDVGVGDDLAIEIPMCLLGDDCMLYISKDGDEHGAYLECDTESERYRHLASLIAAEQRAVDDERDALENAYAGEGLDSFLQDLDEEFLWAVTDMTAVEIDSQRRVPLSELNLDGITCGSTLTLYGDSRSFVISSKEGADERMVAIRTEIDTLLFMEG